MSDFNNLKNTNKIPKNDLLSAENGANIENCQKNPNDANFAHSNTYNPFHMTDEEINKVVETNLVFPNFVRKKSKP